MSFRSGSTPAYAITKMRTFSKYGKIRQLGHEENKEIFSNPEEEILIQEKIDGANFRFMFKDGNIIFGSRTQELSEDVEHKYAKNFRRCIDYVNKQITDRAMKFPGSVVSLWKKYEGLVFYGECCVSHTMPYNWEMIPPYLGFDINNEDNPNYPKRYLPYLDVLAIFWELGLTVVPQVNLIKAKDIGKVDDSKVPKSLYASLSVENQQAEGIVFKKYSFIEGSKEPQDQQIFAKYVRDKFKEDNMKVFGGRSVKPNTDNDEGELIFKYCTNARIDKMIFKLLDDGEKLDLPLMSKLPKKVLEDIYEEHGKDILTSNWTIDFKELRKKVPARCLSVLKQVMVNNSLNDTKV